MKYAVARKINTEGEVINEGVQAQMTVPADEGLLDAYSRAVIEAAEKVSPRTSHEKAQKAHLSFLCLLCTNF